MSSLHTVGTISYYIGLLIMVWGFLSLGMGLSDMLIQVTGQIGEAASGGEPSCANPPCLSDRGGQDSGILAQVLSPVDGYVDGFFEAMGIFELGGDTSEMYYPRFRRFFSLLIVGMVLLVIGIILRLFDDLVEFVEKYKKKKAELLKKSVLYSERLRERIRV
ncbi:MAG: hypothetical protein ABIH83_01815 [Candidatus Micrarchaeota archaeon]